MVAAHGVERNSYWLDHGDHGLRTLGRRGKARRLAQGRSVMDDQARKIISFRRQEEGWHSLPARPVRKT
jgi:hypothetical protein